MDPRAKFEDSEIARVICESGGSDGLAESFCWSSGYGWMQWTGNKWSACTEVTVREAIAIRARDEFVNAVKGSDLDEIDGWRSLLNVPKQNRVMTAAKGPLEVDSSIFDSDPDVLNCQNGLVNLRTGELRACLASDYVTKITSGRYVSGYEHPDWQQALEAVPEDIVGWLQVRMGQGVTGHPTPDGILPIFQGNGENGKSAVTTDGIVPALGDYGSMASAKLITSVRRGQDHSTEKADLRGKRVLISEEMTEGRALDVKMIKDIQDVSRIRARLVYRDNIEFNTSHSLFATTNYVPAVNEVDHGTWRRLALVVFPYTFGKGGAENNGLSRVSDPNLKHRIRSNESDQHDAVVTWVVEGAIRWYQSYGPYEMQLPPRVVDDTHKWRISADKILGAWESFLEPSVGGCVLVSELLSVFNEWLETNGHASWSMETFVTRFEQHEETKRHGVVKVRTRDLNGLCTAYSKELKQASVWKGVTFRNR